MSKITNDGPTVYHATKHPRLVYAWEGDVEALRAEIERLREELAGAQDDALRLHREKAGYYLALLEIVHLPETEGFIGNDEARRIAREATQYEANEQVTPDYTMPTPDELAQPTGAEERYAKSKAVDGQSSEK